jgi:hypothetical protein
MANGLDAIADDVSGSLCLVDQRSTYLRGQGEHGAVVSGVAMVGGSASGRRSLSGEM